MYSTVHTVIKALQDEAADPHSFLTSRGGPRKPELMLLIEHLEESLKELDAIVSNHQGLARRGEPRIRNRFRLAIEDLDSVRGKLTFHITAINAFTASLSRGNLVQIETTLLALVDEVRQGRRRRPSLASFREENDGSVWRELESDLVGDGISREVIAKHKAAIQTFIRGLLSDDHAETTSLVEVASLVESADDDDNDDAGLDSLSHSVSNMDFLTIDPMGLLTTTNVQNGGLAVTDDEYEDPYESADEELPHNYASALTYKRAVEGLPHNDANASRPIFNDALNYIDQVKVDFRLHPEKYDQFLDVFKSFKNQLLDIPGVIDWIIALFVCYPALIEAFNIFLPRHYRLECGLVDKSYGVRVWGPDFVYMRIPDLQALQLLALGQGQTQIELLRWIDPAALDILRPHPRTLQPSSSLSGITEVRKAFLRRSKALVARLKTTREMDIQTGPSDPAKRRVLLRQRQPVASDTVKTHPLSWDRNEVEQEAGHIDRTIRQ